MVAPSPKHQASDRLLLSLSSEHRLPRPLCLAVEAGIANPDTTFLDYGGHPSRSPADLVYLGYVLNCLASGEEQRQTLVHAWELTRKVLIVAAHILIDEGSGSKIVYGGEYITYFNSTYQYSSHPDLKTDIDEILDVDAVSAALGVYFIFRDAECRNKAISYLYRSPMTTPSVQTGVPPFDDYQEILAPLMDFFTKRGRLPVIGECSTEAELLAKFGSFAQAFAVILQGSDRHKWEAITEQRRQDLLISIACEGRALPSSYHLDFGPKIHNDILTFFGSDQQAREIAHQMLLQIKEPGVIVNACQASAIGKKLPGALYVHVSALHALDPLLRLYEAYARRTIGQIDGATLVKFNIEQPKISYLFYPDFDTDPHPALKASLQINLPDLHISYRDYDTSDNPPVLHRKETFVTPDYPFYERFVNLTRQEEKLGLLNNRRRIGTREGWRQCLADYQVEIEDHQVVQNRIEDHYNLPTLPKIERHKAAIVRRELSRPMRLALEAGLFTEDTTFFDYGCGHGGDIQRIAEQGYQSSGWDPYYRPDTPRTPADVVNLGYVINVIEDQAERREAMIQAWELTNQVLIVASLVLIDDQGSGQVAYGDGVITRRNTFQKYYEQEELKAYIEQVLNVEAIPAALGIYFVFRDPRWSQIIQAYRFRSRTAMPRLLKSFEDYQELLAPLMEFVRDRGRLPIKGELPQETEILNEFRTFHRAFQVIMQVTQAEEWEAITEKRRQDILSYLAVTNFGKRHKLSDFNPYLQNDIKALFGSYLNACLITEQIVYSLNDLSRIVNCCQHSKIGQISPKFLRVHISALEALEPLLRIYEGIVSRTIGRMDEATVIQFHTKSPKISYLFYPHFDNDPHPALHTSMQIDLRNLHVSYRDYDSDNPPILHRKETLVTPDYPLYEKFAKLTRQEENWKLLDNLPGIRTRKAWLNCLQEHCAEIRDHRVYWRKDADPYRLKVLKAAHKNAARKKNLISESQNPLN